VSAAAAPAAGVYQGAALYAPRLVLAVIGLLYFHSAGNITGFLPMPLEAVLGLIVAYALLNLLLLTRLLRADIGLIVPLDLVILAVIVWEDPYPGAPVTVLLLSSTFDYGRLLPPPMFGSTTLLALGILGFNVWARLHSHQFALAPGGAWLSGAIAALMINFFTVARAAARARAERRRMTERIDSLNRREEASVRLQLRQARLGECMQFTGQSRDEFARRALDCFVRELGAVAGAVYELVQEEGAGGDGALFPLATHAADLPRLQGRRVGLDEGLVGACAAQGKAIELDRVPEGYFRLESGLAQGNPPRLLIMPLKVQTRLVGIVEFALLTAPAEEDREVLERMLPVFATGLLVAARAFVGLQQPAAAGLRNLRPQE